MDLNDIWQEHKVWILGVLAGLIVFLVADTVIADTWDSGTFEANIQRTEATLRRNRFYGAAEQRQAREAEQAIDEALVRAESKAYFQVRERYDLAGKGDPTLHYLRTTSEVKTDLLRGMDAANVDFTQRQLGLPAQSPVDRDEIQDTLIGLDVIEDALTRLLTSSDRIQSASPDAHGLRAVDKIQIDREKRGPTRTRRYGVAAKQEVSLGDRVSVRIRFAADALTLQDFLESLVGGQNARPLLLEEIAAANTGEPGDPMEINVKFLALRKSSP